MIEIVKPGYKILSYISPGAVDELKLIERCGRVSYRSEDKISSDSSSAERFIAARIRQGHESILEHSSLTVLFTCDRGVSHELVRHRLCSFTQESTRYCDYGGNIKVIRPPEIEEDPVANRLFLDDVMVARDKYTDLRKHGVKPEIARAVLPTCLATEIAVTANYREWRHIFDLRCDRHAHPQIRSLMQDLLKDLYYKIPVVFDDLYEVDGMKGEEKNGSSK